jgi:hypothetical protein
MSDPFPSNGHPHHREDPSATLTEIHALLERIAGRLDELITVARRWERHLSQPPAEPEASYQHLSPADLTARLSQMQSAGRAYDVLVIRRKLAEQLAPPELLEMNRNLARWFVGFFQKALRAGQAASVAGALEQAVIDLGDLEEIRPLAESLPLVLKSVGLMQEIAREDEEDA